MKDTRIAPAHSGMRTGPQLPRASSCFDAGPSLRVLVIPGLGGSGPAHWQSWLQRQYARSVRVEQTDWDTPDLDAWADRIEAVVSRHPRTQWVAAAHSFGVLALAHHLQGQCGLGRVSAVRAALLVAPADPVKFSVSRRLSRGPALGIPSLVVGSTTDPWMSEASAQRWASHWGAAYASLGDAGHINAESGHGPWMLGRYHVDQLIRDQHRRRRIEREARLAGSRWTISSHSPPMPWPPLGGYPGDEDKARELFPKLDQTKARADYVAAAAALKTLPAGRCSFITPKTTNASMPAGLPMRLPSKPRA